MNLSISVGVFRSDVKNKTGAFSVHTNRDVHIVCAELNGDADKLAVAYVAVRLGVEVYSETACDSERTTHTIKVNHALGGNLKRTVALRTGTARECV